MMSPTATATAVFLSAAPSSSSTRRRRSRLAAISASLSPSSSSSSEEPLLVRAARGEDGLPRPPAWMMRQAGRYMAEYQALAKRHPSFRERSENTDLIVEITLQPWRAFAPDGVILFSDILTPLPAIGVPFDISDSKGPVIQSPVRSEDQVRQLVPIDLDKLHFVGDSLRILRNEIDGKAALLGFVGAPWTIATYVVEGGMTNTYTNIKSMCHTAPNVLRGLLSHLAQAISDYIIYQANSGAQCIQIFDSWGGQLPPHVWEQWSKPYIKQIVSRIKKECPHVPLVLYINGNGGLLERMKDTGVDVIGLDWTVDMADGRRRLGNGIGVQGNVDPAFLFSPLPVLTDEIHRVVRSAGPKGHILNLGHGVLQKTPEEAVAHFFDVTRSLRYDTLFQGSVAGELQAVA
ncbi:uroporphyrinogen decarboxylase 1, chloroplastic [Panicum miliaceum]|uniref:Uroporphyrinogen decarboxylase n=1 Tax=Panicum miliaceum TaxID=4540 RepID=A0A3L6SN94_PANMI|nr:uroporphyrinogen decarboxylase 1, chloroplastic [Panicum miliaceum]